jgi:hypothetical protein
MPAHHAQHGAPIRLDGGGLDKFVAQRGARPSPV